MKVEQNSRARRCEFENLYIKYLYLFTKIYTHSSNAKTCKIQI